MPRSILSPSEPCVRLAPHTAPESILLPKLLATVGSVDPPLARSARAQPFLRHYPWLRTPPLPATPTRIGDKPGHQPGCFQHHSDRATSCRTPGDMDPRLHT